jgi:hypothetical protein
MLASCVLYETGTVPFLKKKSAVEPHNDENISYEHFERYAKKAEFKIEGKMPDDFRAKLASAIRKSILLNRNEKNELLEAINEPTISDPDPAL